MITPGDISVFPIQEDWVKGGLDYALRSWSMTFNRLGRNNMYSRLSKIIVGVVAEHATRHALSKNRIQHDISGATEWYAVDRYDIRVADKPIDIKSIFLDRSNVHQMRKLAREGAIDDLRKSIPQFTALVPADQFNSASAKKRAGRDKLYIFPVVDADSNPADGHRAVCHLMWDYRWLKKASHKDDPSLGKLTVASKRGGKIRIIGTSAKNTIATEDIVVSSEPRTTQKSYWQVFAIQLISPSPIDLTIRSETRRLTEKLRPQLGFAIEPKAESPSQNDWSIVGLGSGSVYISGVASDRQLRIHGRIYPRFSKDVLQYPDTLIDNWGMPIRKLDPIGVLKK